MTFYNSIDELPIYNWNKIIDTNDFTWVCKNRTGKEDVRKCQIKYSELYCEFIDVFGINEQLREVIELQNELAILKSEKEVNNDKSLQLFIDIKTIELNKKLNTKNEKGTSIKVHIEKFLGFRINEKEVSVREFYEYVKELNNGRQG